jgi:zinc protease
MRVGKRLTSLAAGYIVLILSFGISQASPLPEVHRSQWENGLIFLTSEQRHLPMIYLRLLVPGGSRRDPQGKEGLAYLAASLLASGTQAHTALEINQALDFMGASLVSDCDEDFSTLSLKVLKKDLNQGIRWFSDVLLRPSFPQEEVVKKKNEIQAAIQSEKDEPGQVAQRAFLEVLFGNTPYGTPPQGKETSIPGISREDVVSYYRTFYRPNNAILVAVGDFDTEQLQNFLKKSLEQWASAPLPEESFRADFPTSRKVVLRDMDITQANIVLGMKGIQRSNPDYYPLSVMNYILGGGGFASRLMEEIRTKRGLAYSVYSAVDARKFSGSLEIALETKNESAGEAIDLALQEVRKIREAPVSPNELEGAKQYLTGSYPLRLDSNIKLATFLSMVEFYGLGLEYMRQYPFIINQVTPQDVLRVASRYLDPDNYVLVVVANQKKADLKGLK